MEPSKISDDLLKQLAGTMGKQKVVELTGILNKGPVNVRELIELTLTTDKAVAFRAAWLLENLIVKDPEQYIGDLDYLLDQFVKINNESCQRHYTKIVAHLTDVKCAKPVYHNVSKIDMQPVVEHCFDLLINPKTPAAVKVFAMQILFNLRLRYSWISEELTEQLLIMVDNGQPSIKSRGNKLLNRLNQGIKP